MNDQYNPDYPVANSGSFLDHSYLQVQNMPSNSFYYPGLGLGNTFSQSTYYPDSRRNDGLQQNPGMPMMGIPQTTPVQAQNPVMPFSSYPSSTPNQQPGFNSLVESRRFDNQPASVGSNPWANPQPQQPQFAAPVTPQPQVQSPWAYKPQQYSYMDPNCSALYSTPNFGFDKNGGAWDNVCTTPRPIDAPWIQWSQPQQPTYQTPVYPAFNYNYPQTNMSWNDIAEKNWSKGNL